MTEESTPPRAPEPFQIDPESGPDEFAHIPSRRRPPVVAIFGAAFALFLAFRLKNDVGYALSSSTPVELGDVRGLGGRPSAALPTNRYVTLRGRPERESAVVLDSRGSWVFTQFFRLRAAGGRFFVRRVPDPLPIDRAERDVFSGRLVRFSELSFADSIAQHFAKRVDATHLFATAGLADALKAGRTPLTLTDLAGDELTLSGSDRLAFDVARPDTYAVEWTPEAHGQVDKVRTLLRDGGASITSDADSPGGWRMTVTIPSARSNDLLSAIGLPGVSFRAVRDTVELPVSELHFANGGFVTGPKPLDRIPAERVLSIRTRAAVQIPADAVLLIEGEVPRHEMKSVVILAFLAAFAAVNLLGLRRA